MALQILAHLIFAIGIFSFQVEAQDVSPSEVVTDSQTNRPYDGQGNPIVGIDPSNMMPIGDGKHYEFRSYRDRRPRWGKTFSLGASSFMPTNYQPNFVEADYSTVYKQSSPLVELNIVVKRNLPIGSIGGEIGGGYFKVNSRPTADILGVPTTLDSAMEIALVRLGAVFSFDMIFKDPYFVPYVSAGAYLMHYRESRPQTAFTGNTQVAPYFVGGAQFTLDWLDQKSAQNAYRDIGLESTFIFLEARILAKSSAARDPNFGGGPHFDAGVRVEF